MKKSITFIILILALGGYFFMDGEITGKVTETNSFVADIGDVQVYFCPHEDCTSALTQFLETAEKSIHCAVFELDLPEVQKVILNKQKEIDVKVVTDNDYLYEFNYSFVKTDTWGLMHNKFCIVDSKKVSTGSMNPTVNGANKNNNNLLLINSVTTANNYEDEFQEMWSGTFKKGNNVKNPSVMVNDIQLEMYFCPEDDCADKIEEELEKAEQSIHFMTFSFTHEGIGNTLLLKDLDGVHVEGVMEARQVSKYSRFEQLSYQDIDVIKDGNKQNMHHKVFIVDESTVITGSMNPSAGGDSRNDENLIIIRDSTIASEFMEEYRFVKGEALDK